MQGTGHVKEVLEEKEFLNPFSFVIVCISFGLMALHGQDRYSPFKQIHRENVGGITVAWTHATGDQGTTIECRPLVVDGVMYVTSPSLRVIALDAANGRQRWSFVTEPPKPVGWTVNRGLAYWRKGSQERILMGTPDGRLISLHAQSGRPDKNFGDRGVVDLKAGVTNLSYGVTSAPAIFEDLVILGFAVGEGPGPAAPGDIRAFDVRNGREVWRFHTVPRPGEFGHETWTGGAGDSWKDRGGVNAWGGLTVDEQNKLVFAGLGSPAFDFYGGDRKGANLFGNSVVALDARTGKRVWHFQTVRHDIWDYDLPTPPVLVKSQGKEAVAQVTKTGHVWILDRLTGVPLFGYEERAVPPSDVPGEEAWPTQILPKKPPPIVPQVFEPSDASPETRALRCCSIFTPPSLQGTVTLPGFHGGANWSGAAWDPRTGLLYVNTNNVPNLTTLVPRKEGGYGIKGYVRFTDQDGNPASKPPWGMLTAVDLNRGEIAWQKTLGDGNGSENFGGAIVTAGGLVFIASTKDEKFRAFAAATGDLLWEYQLPAGGYAAPVTYMVKGKQYVTIAAGGGGKLGTKRGDSFVTFALP